MGTSALLCHLYSYASCWSEKTVSTINLKSCFCCIVMNYDMQSCVYECFQMSQYNMLVIQKMSVETCDRLCIHYSNYPNYAFEYFEPLQLVLPPLTHLYEFKIIIYSLPPTLICLQIRYRAGNDSRKHKLYQFSWFYFWGPLNWLIARVWPRTLSFSSYYGRFDVIEWLLLRHSRCWGRRWGTMLNLLWIKIPEFELPTSSLGCGRNMKPHLTELQSGTRY